MRVVPVVHVPGTVVSVVPTRAFPRIVGVGAVRMPAATAAVGFDVFDTDV